MSAEIIGGVENLNFSKSNTDIDKSHDLCQLKANEKANLDQGGLEDGTDEDEVNESKKKKKRRPRKKKVKNTDNEDNKVTGVIDNNNATVEQTSPPRIQVSKLFPHGKYPMGEIQFYKELNEESGKVMQNNEFKQVNNVNLARTTAEEYRYTQRQEKLNDTVLSEYRQAAEIHRQVRQWSQRTIQPGMSLTEIAEGIEDSVRHLSGHMGLETGDCLIAGMGFPTGVSLNNCAAHYTPNAGNTKILEENDVMKVDFGVHVNGRIVDSAFTITFAEDKYAPLLESVREATNTGVKEAGIDVRLGELGGIIQEVIESYELTLDNGKTVPIKPIRNLNGHTIDQYTIHGGKSVPIVHTPDERGKMEEGEIYAIETFCSTGRGIVREDVSENYTISLAFNEMLARTIKLTADLINVNYTVRWKLLITLGTQKLPSSPRSPQNPFLRQLNPYFIR